MAKKPDKREKDETEVLFPDVTVLGVKITPWTWKQFVAAVPIFQQVQAAVEARNIPYTEIEKRPMDLLNVCLPFATEIISLTTGHKTEEIEKWSAEKVMKIIVVIIGQNAEQIKNSFGLSAPLIRALQDRLG